MREIINEAIKQLNNEGLLEGTKITQQGKGTAESIIRDNGFTIVFIETPFIIVFNTPSACGGETCGRGVWGETT